MAKLRSMGIEVAINTKPQELPDPIPFEKDRQHAAYDRDYAHRFWRILLSADIVLNEFRSRFIGKCSPVQFFWGSFDLACTRFSGRPAPPRKGVITREAYSHEVISAGFWPGGGPVPARRFTPMPRPLRPDYRMSTCNRQPPSEQGSSEFLLMYDDVRRADSPRAMLLDFFREHLRRRGEPC